VFKAGETHLHGDCFGQYVLFHHTKSSALLHLPSAVVKRSVNEKAG